MVVEEVQAKPAVVGDPVRDSSPGYPVRTEWQAVYGATRLAFLATVLALGPGPLLAQTAALTGRVLDVETRVPLAGAIVERRGGMLIHGAIIARELGIPCVNGVSDAILSIADGEVMTVDGYLGIVTIGPPEFDLETRTCDTGRQ